MRCTTPDGAQRFDYPMGVLRLSLSTYIWPRRTIYDNIAHQDLYPTRGIVAGSGFAMGELQATLAIPLMYMHESHPKMPITTFVNDLASSVCCRDENEAIEIM